MTLQNIYTLDVDLKKSSYINEPIVTQNDSIKFIVNVFNDEVPFDLNTVTTFTLASARSDKQSVMSLGNKTATNQITFELGSTELAKVGRVNAAIQLYDADGRISTLPFTYQVIEDLITDYVPSENERTLIELVLTEAPVIIENAREIIEEISTLNDTVKSNETDRESNEHNRNSGETIRKSNESERIWSEIERDGEEAKRVTAEAQRKTDELLRIDAEAQRILDENIRISNEADRELGFSTVINQANKAVSNIDNFDFVGVYNTSSTYAKNNLVSYNGSTFAALQTVTNITPSDDGVNWRLVAQRGIDGQGSVSSVNGIFPDIDGNVTVEISDTSWEAITNKPTTFTPSTHSHTISQVTGLQTELDKKYVKPSTGIPSTDLTTSIQTSLGKADTALQSVPDASTTVKGLMTTTDKIKLNGIESGANYVSVEDSLASTSTTSALSANQGKVISDKIDILTGNVDTHKTKKASTTELGHVMIDGTTITVDSNGKISSSSKGGATIANATSIDGVTYNVTIEGVASLTDGLQLIIKPNMTNTSWSRLSVNGLASKWIEYANGVSPNSGYFKMNAYYSLIYNGSVFVIQGDGYGITDTFDSTSINYVPTARALKEVHDMKANKQQEDYISGSVASGITGDLKYFIDNFGIVHVTLYATKATALTAGNIICTLPVGYRPSVKHWFVAMGYSGSGTSGNPLGLELSTGGVLKVSYQAYSGSSNTAECTFSFRK